MPGTDGPSPEAPIPHALRIRRTYLKIIFLALLAGIPVPLQSAESPSPRRLVSLAPSVTEILFRLGLGDRVVGVTMFCNFPPETAGKARIGGFSNPSAEKIVSLKPDLVIVIPNVGNREAVNTVQRLGIDVLVLEIRDLEGLFRSIREIGSATGVSRQADVLAGFLQAEISSLGEQVVDLPHPSILIAFSRDPFIIAGPGSFPGELVRIAGGMIPVEDNDSHYPRLGMEMILKIAPEVILQTAMDGETTGNADAQLLESWKDWPALPAVAAGRVHTVDPDLILRPGPRVVEGIRELIRILHPGAVLEKSNAAPVDP